MTGTSGNSRTTFPRNSVACGACLTKVGRGVDAGEAVSGGTAAAEWVCSSSGGTAGVMVKVGVYSLLAAGGGWASGE